MENENNNQNIVNFALVMAGFIAYFTTAMIFETLAGSFGAVARVRNIELVKHGLPVAVGLITFVLVFVNKRAYEFLDEAVTEVRKVVWPSRKDTTAMTIVVCVMVVMAGIGLGVFDFFASQLIKMFTAVN